VRLQEAHFRELVFAYQKRGSAGECRGRERLGDLFAISQSRECLDRSAERAKEARDILVAQYDAGAVDPTRLMLVAQTLSLAADFQAQAHARLPRDYRLYRAWQAAGTSNELPALLDSDTSAAWKPEAPPEICQRRRSRNNRPVAHSCLTSPRRVNMIEDAPGHSPGAGLGCMITEHLSLLLRAFARACVRLPGVPVLSDRHTRSIVPNGFFCITSTRARTLVDKFKEFVTLNQVQAPTEIFGRKIYHCAHRSDVLRLTMLKEHGGIYMDYRHPLPPPLHAAAGHQCVMEGRASEGSATPVNPERTQRRVHPCLVRDVCTFAR